jgi:nicotinate-nucleotide adenylyltransferase
VGATGEQRYEMTQLAATGHPGWSASRIELDREGPSYTYDTLVELTLAGPALSERDTSHRDVPRESRGTQIFFITGADAFAEIATWSRYPAVLDLANFVVVSRPGIRLVTCSRPVGFRRPSASTRGFWSKRTTSTSRPPTFGGASAPATASPDPVARYIAEHRLCLETRSY